MGGWRLTLKAEGPQEPIRRIHTIRKTGETVLAGGNSAYTAYSAHRGFTLPVDTLKPVPAMTELVRQQMAFDAENMFIRLWRRLANRFNKVMRPGYLAWIQTHELELWAWRETTQIGWDDPQVWSAFKACSVSCADYRRRMYQWTRVELTCIRHQRRDKPMSNLKRRIDLMEKEILLHADGEWWPSFETMLAQIDGVDHDPELFFVSQKEIERFFGEEELS